MVKTSENACHREVADSSLTYQPSLRKLFTLVMSTICDHLELNLATVMYCTLFIANFIIGY